MPLDLTTGAAVGTATKADDDLRRRGNERALIGSPLGLCLIQWGSLDAFLADTTEVDLPYGAGAAGFEIDGTLAGYVAIYLEVVAIRHPDAAGTVTCTVDLYNVTTPGQVASSPVAISLTTANATHQKSGSLTLPASVARFKVRGKTSDATRLVAAIVRVMAKGS